MAAKVVIVAVPTVLSIASIRVYTVREESTDGLVPREKLNIYTPLTQSAQAEFVPERLGVIESGVAAARERILPLVQAVKGACSSVKRGSVKLYHTGEDVYYYLKDPPPEFLPRFGTITMAGLLGMFMARKGSRFRRLAVPLGLMSAGASVCYPAQAVAVVKVTGKKVYAAGQWGSAAVSSLLTPKPQEPVTNKPGSSQPQAATVPNPEAAVAEARSTTGSSAQSSAIPETEVVSAEFVPLSDEPVVSVISEEASSVTPAEISPVQTPTDTHTHTGITDPVEYSVSAETKNFATSEEIPTLADREEPSDTKQTVENVSTHARPPESLPSLESEVVEAAPVESASAEAAPVEATLVDFTEFESVPFSEEPPAPKVTCEPSVPVVESAKPEHTPQPELADQPKVVPAEETPTPELTTPAPQQSEAENNKGGSGFKSDPALMDFGQSSPEDEDLYSTRS